LPLYRCHFYDNGNVQVFQKSTTITDGMIGLLSIVGADGVAANIVQGGLPTIIDSTLISASDTAPTEAMIKAYHAIIMFNTILSGRFGSVTGVIGGTAAGHNDGIFGGVDWYNLSTDIGADLRTMIDHESPHIDIAPQFAAIPNDLTISADLSSATLYPRIAAETVAWIKAGQVDGVEGEEIQIGAFENGLWR
jgi:hypothetical protein